MRITSNTRRRLFDTLADLRLPYHGALTEEDFLSRLFALSDLPSQDPSKMTLLDDFFQHRVRNQDWDDAWVWRDPRLNLLNGPDAKVVEFLELMVSPEVRSEPLEVMRLVDLISNALKLDRLMLAPVATGDTRAGYRVRELSPLDSVLSTVDADLTGLGQQVDKHLTRLRAAENAEDSAAIIGAGKELLETVCKTVLREFGIPHDSTTDLPKLARETLKALEVLYDPIPDAGRVEDSIRRMTGSLVTVASEVAALRNVAGTGHGRDARAEDLLPLHAQLVADVAGTFTRFVTRAARLTRERDEARKAELAELVKRRDELTLSIASAREELARADAQEALQREWRNNSKTGSADVMADLVGRMSQSLVSSLRAGAGRRIQAAEEELIRVMPRIEEVEKELRRTTGAQRSESGRVRAAPSGDQDGRA